MFDIILAGGWIMLPLFLCSIIALAIIIERSWCLRINKIIPQGLAASVVNDLKNKTLSQSKLTAIQSSSALGSLLIIGIKNHKKDRIIILNLLEDAGRSIIHKLERNLTMLGTIATITPLLGLLGTVIGMIDVFSIITEQGVGNANTLAGGISQALITTAAGLSIAIPSLVFYRSFQRRLDEIAYKLEHEAINFVDALRTINKISSSSISAVHSIHDLAEVD